MPQPAVLERFGPTIHAIVSQPAVPNLASPQQVQSQVVPFLIDTGANESCIDARVARALQLPVIDIIPMCGIGGVHPCDVVMCQIQIPNVSHSMSGRFACVDLEGQPHQALLGRDFLKHVVMIYDGASGHVTILK